eukprot:UN1675
MATHSLNNHGCASDPNTAHTRAATPSSNQRREAGRSPSLLRRPRYPSASHWATSRCWLSSDSTFVNRCSSIANRHRRESTCLLKRLCSDFTVARRSWPARQIAVLQAANTTRIKLGNTTCSSFKCRCTDSLLCKPSWASAIEEPCGWEASSLFSSFAIQPRSACNWRTSLWFSSSTAWCLSSSCPMRSCAIHWSFSV